MGFISYAFEDSPASLHPVIVTQHGQVGFYHGALKPTVEKIALYYSRLETDKEAFFPVHFQSSQSIPGCVTQGVLDGFYYRTFESEQLIKII